MPISPPQPPPYSTTATTGLSRLIRTTLSYDTNVMLAAIIALLLVILFVLLLHLYTRWFLLQARRRSRNSSATVPRVLHSRFNQRFTIIETSNSDTHSSSKLGLPFAVIASLPLFVYKFQDVEMELDCAICLSVFEDDEIGRKLPGCGHAFHVECIDMWLNCHSTCPICRTIIDHCNYNRKIEINDSDHNEEDLSELRSEIEISTTINDQILEHRETADNSSSSSSSIEELQSGKKLSITSSSSRSGGKVHPSSTVDGDESDV